MPGIVARYCVGARPNARAEMPHRLPFGRRLGDEPEAALTLVGRGHQHTPYAQNAVPLAGIRKAREQAPHDLRLARRPVYGGARAAFAAPHLGDEFAPAHE